MELAKRNETGIRYLFYGGTGNEAERVERKTFCIFTHEQFNKSDFLLFICECAFNKSAFMILMFRRNGFAKRFLLAIYEVKIWHSLFALQSKSNDNTFYHWH